MATTIPAVLALLQTSAAINKCAAWNNLPPFVTSAANRATVITAILGGTVATEADALALIATAASGIPGGQKAVWDIMVCNPATNG